VKVSGHFPDGEDDVRKEENVKEKSKGIEGRMSRMREAKRWRWSEDAKEIGSSEARGVIYSQRQIQREHSMYENLPPPTE
jgi:hypothetical protein